jgi:hypothetical protein
MRPFFAVIAAAVFALLGTVVAVTYSDDTNPVIAAACQPSAKSVEQLFAPRLECPPALLDANPPQHLKVARQSWSKPPS